MSVATSSAAPARERGERGTWGLLGARLVGFLAGAAVVVPLTSNVGGFAEIGQWWNQPIAVQKLVVWALLWELLGVSAVRPGRPAPLGGALYWLQTETLRLPPGHRFARFARGTRRTPLDVALYLLPLCIAVVLLCSGVTQGEPYDTLPRPELVLLLAALTVLGCRDRTAFLAARPELYAVLLAVFLGPAGSLAFGVGLAIVAALLAEALSHAAGRPTFAPETWLLLAALAAFVASAGFRPGSAAGWALLPVAALGLGGPLLRRAPVALWLFRDADAEQRFAAAVVTPGTDWTSAAPPASPAALRAFAELLPRAVPDPSRWRPREGAIVARVTLGGDAPAGRGLLATVQHECDFPPGQLRVVEVAPPGFRSRARRYRVLDAASGVLETGTVRTARRGARPPAPPPAAPPAPVPPAAAAPEPPPPPPVAPARPRPRPQPRRRGPV